MAKKLKSQTMIAPMSVTIHCIIVVLALVFALWFYTNTLATLHRQYYHSIMNANAICHVLTDYGTSPQYVCNPDNNSNQVLTPNELLALMSAAQIAKMNDYDNPNQLLQLSQSGVAGWLAAVIALTPNREMQGAEKLNLASIFLGYPINTERSDCSDNISRVGSLYPLMVLYKELGIGDHSQGHATSTCLPFDAKVIDQAQKLGAALAGIHPTTLQESYFSRLFATDYWPSFIIPSHSSSVKIKAAMNDQWHLYELERFYTQTLTENGAEIQAEQLAKVEIFEPRFNGAAYQSVAKIAAKDTPWFKQNPEQLQAAVHAFSLMIVNEIYRIPEVKIARYLYQSMNGIIQFFIFALAIYVLFLLLWRAIATLFANYPADPREELSLFSMHQPMLFVGSPAGFEDAIPRSRVYIDHLISSLPLLGLFGTVVGILLGLPNAAAAIIGSGPGTTEAINELFIQLGLAFSTTAIAIFFVILLDFVWLLLQSLEDHQLYWVMRHYSDRPAVQVKQRDVPLSGDSDGRT